MNLKNSCWEGWGQLPPLAPPVATLLLHILSYLITYIANHIIYVFSSVRGII